MRPLPAFVSLIAIALLPAAADARVWKEAGSDRTLEGDFSRKEGDKVVITRANGTSVKVPLSRLSEEDRKFVDEQAAAKDAPAETADVYKWETDFDAAKQRAKAEKKAMLLDFTGSDWCGWCIRLKKEVFDHEEFQEYAKKNLVLVELDFPRSKELPEEEKEQNEALAAEYGIRGYPTIVLLNSRGREVARTGYQEGGPEKYVEHLEELLK
jgi:thioredoxin-related protein